MQEQLQGRVLLPFEIDGIATFNVLRPRSSLKPQDRT